MPCMLAHLLLFVDVVPCFSFCREVLKLSRDFESLTANDEKSGASDAGHDASALENLLVQQFSLGSWFSSTTTPGTSRSNQRRRKPAAELIRRKRGSAGPSTTDFGVFGSSAGTHLISLQCPALPPTTHGSMYTFTATARLDRTHLCRR